MSFTVAIVGRPNVGKSTLFNRLVGRRLALVDDRPGVTRDRREGAARLGDLNFTMVDNAGFDEAAPDSLTGRMAAQTEVALRNADAVFFMCDARAGLTPADRAFANLVRRAGKPVVVVANKSEAKAGEAGALESYALGLGDPVAISAEHEWGGRRFRLFDTAGMRRRARIDEKLEKLSVADALHAIRFAEVVIVLLDAERPFEEQDVRIADLVQREGRALVLGMNKWDIAERKPGAAGKLQEQADYELPQVKGVPIVAISGRRGGGLDRLIQAVIDAYAVWNRRVPTNALNRWLSHTTEAHPPPAVRGRRIKLNYITQQKSRPRSEEHT